MRAYIVPHEETGGFNFQTTIISISDLHSAIYEQQKLITVTNANYNTVDSWFFEPATIRNSRLFEAIIFLRGLITLNCKKFLNSSKYNLKNIIRSVYSIYKYID